MSLISKTREAISRIDLPVQVQEMRRLQRGTRQFQVMFLYACVLSITALIVLRQIAVLDSGYASTAAMLGRTRSFSALLHAEAGRQMFLWLSMAQLAMIALVVPGYAAGAVAQERERGTFDLLALTLLSSSSIITQKIAAAVCQALMLTVASAPVVAVVFFLGGVSPLEVVLVYAILWVTAIELGTLGVLCSSLFKNTRTAVFAAYLTTLLLFAGIPLTGAWLQNGGLSSFGATSADPLVFVVVFICTGALLALVVYAVSVLFRGEATGEPQARTAMAFLAGMFVVLLVPYMRSPYDRGVSLPSCVNPFIAVQSLITSYHGGLATSPYGPYGAYGPGPMTPYGSPGYSYDPSFSVVATTIVCGVAISFLFRKLSVIRFEALRRS